MDGRITAYPGRSKYQIVIDALGRVTYRVMSQPLRTALDTFAQQVDSHSTAPN